MLLQKQPTAYDNEKNIFKPYGYGEHADVYAC